MSEIYNDHAPVGWSAYIPAAQALTAEREKKPIMKSYTSCSYAAEYKAMYRPTCGCDACADKWENKIRAEERQKVIEEIREQGNHMVNLRYASIGNVPYSVFDEQIKKDRIRAESFLRVARYLEALK